MTREQFNNILAAIGAAGMNYVFIDKTPENLELVKSTLNEAFTVVVGQGEHARIKISW